MITIEHLRTANDRIIPDNPILVTGHARAGTTVVTSALHVCGAFMGPTSPSHPFGPTGVAENPHIRGLIVKPYLKTLGADPLGQFRFPEPEDLDLSPAPFLKNIIHVLLELGGYQVGPWGYKDAKLCHIAPLFHEMFPKARWLIVKRRKDDVMASCERTGFMNATGVLDWGVWYDTYEDALSRLRATEFNVTEIQTDDLLHGDISALKPVIEGFDLEWKPDLIPPLIKPRKAA